MKDEIRRYAFATYIMSGVGSILAATVALWPCCDAPHGLSGAEIVVEAEPAEITVNVRHEPIAAAEDPVEAVDGDPVEVCPRRRVRFTLFKAAEGFKPYGVNIAWPEDFNRDEYAVREGDVVRLEAGWQNHEGENP